MTRQRYKAPTCKDCAWFYMVWPGSDVCSKKSKDPDAPACKKDFMRSDNSRLNHGKHGMGYQKTSYNLKKKLKIYFFNSKQMCIFA